MGKGKSFEEGSKVAYLNYKSIIVKERNDPQVWINITGLVLW